MSRQPDIQAEMAHKTRRGFLTGGIATIAGLAGWAWIASRKPENELQWPLRRVLRVNEKLARGYFSESRLAPTFPRSAAVAELRVNEDIGMDDDIDAENWRMQVAGSSASIAPVTLALDDIKKLPHSSHVTELKCIEGWSQVAAWGGAKFADLAKQFPPPEKARYVSMATANGKYYVGLDLASAMHPQTLLAYELNDQALTDEHGAPLRLVIPTKYGIKNIKQIGSITYSETRPKDYWADQGYDWYAGL